MSFWDWLRGRRASPTAKGARSLGPTPLPGEPLVLECRECGKVFDAVTRRTPCPECDCDDVEVLSE
jgi:Zn finger protein HypA/HybF involved in hydrogenase expression